MLLLVCLACDCQATHGLHQVHVLITTSNKALQGVVFALQLGVFTLQLVVFSQLLGCLPLQVGHLRGSVKADLAM
jgi:hypothetical protein